MKLTYSSLVLVVVAVFGFTVQANGNNAFIADKLDGKANTVNQMHSVTEQHKQVSYPGVEWKPKTDATKLGEIKDKPQRSKRVTYPGVEWKPKQGGQEEYPGVEWKPKN